VHLYEYLRPADAFLAFVFWRREKKREATRWPGKPDADASPAMSSCRILSWPLSPVFDSLGQKMAFLFRRQLSVGI
jgi:hypothetical protein